MPQLWGKHYLTDTIYTGQIEHAGGRCGTPFHVHFLGGKRHNRVHPGHFPSREGENERRPISCAHSSWIKRSTLLCRKMTWVHPVVSFPLFFFFMRMYARDFFVCGSLRCATFFRVDVHDKKILENIYTYVDLHEHTCLH